MQKYVIASNNEHKVKEFQNMLKPFGIKVVPYKDVIKEEFEIEETGKTFEENAKKKANEIANFLKARGEKDYIVMADDSGIEVDYLNGAPGIYSARYAGEHGNDAKNNEKLLHELEGIEEDRRGAKFICQLALINDSGKYLGIKGEVSGRIIEGLAGEGGFGYDPLFYYEPLNKTFGEISVEEKNEISHRAVALKELKQRIYEIL